MRAIVAGADNASGLGRRLSIWKQAAAKTIGVMQTRGYLEAATDPGGQIGSADLQALERHLSKLIGASPVRLDDMPGGMSRGLASKARSATEHAISRSDHRRNVSCETAGGV